MDNELVKNLCAKHGFKQAAAVLINTIDTEAFKELVEKSAFLPDYVIYLVSQKLNDAITAKNVNNFLEFIKFYSQDYEDVIVSSLKTYGNDKTFAAMREKLINGSDEEKAYCVKFFEDNTEFAEIFRNLASSDFEPLAYNCAHSLGKLNDLQSYGDALKNLKSSDDFKSFKAVKFLCAYDNEMALPFLFETLKSSSMAENIAYEMLYMVDVFELLELYPKDSLLLINNIISGLGEIIPLSAVFDLQLYDLIEKISCPITLLHIKQKFDLLTESNEYLFDEDKNTKNEIHEIKNLLYSKPQEYWESLTDSLELDEDLIFFALDLIKDLELDYSDELLNLVKISENPTVLLKIVEVLKSINKLSLISCDEILSKVSDVTIKSVIKSTFES